MEDLVPFFRRAGPGIERDENLIAQAFGFERGSASGNLAQRWGG